MITITQQRIRGDEPPFSPDTYDTTISDALERFLLFEIGYGGRITGLSNTSVTVTTFVMSCKDTMILSGTEDEMRLLVEAACHSMMVDPIGDETPEEYKDKVMSLAVKVTNGNPLMLKLGGGLILGGFSLKAILISMIGVASQEYVQELMKYQNKDLFVCMELVRIDGVPIEEALDLLKPVPAKTLFS